MQDSAALPSPAANLDWPARQALKQRILEISAAKQSFWDSQKKFGFLLARETALRLIDEPSLVRDAEEFLHRSMLGDQYGDIWLDWLKRDPTEIALKLVEDSEDAQLLRETAPVFIVFDQAKRNELVAEAKRL